MLVFLHFLRNTTKKKMLKKKNFEFRFFCDFSIFDLKFFGIFFDYFSSAQEKKGLEVGHKLVAHSTCVGQAVCVRVRVSVCVWATGGGAGRLLVVHLAASSCAVAAVVCFFFFFRVAVVVVVAAAAVACGTQPFGLNVAQHLLRGTLPD